MEGKGKKGEESKGKKGWVARECLQVQEEEAVLSGDRT